MMRTFLILSLTTFAMTVNAADFFSGGFTTSKQGGGKETTRWTLTDYLLQKQRIQLWDSWLALNRQAKIFEIIMAGGPVSYDYRTNIGGVDTTVSEKSQSYQVDIYVSIFGLRAEYEETNHDTKLASGAVSLRLLGTSSRSTNLTLRYGMRKLIDSGEYPEEIWQNQFAEADLNLYLVGTFGLRGNYRHYLPDASDTGTDLKGNKTTGGLFIDIGPFRFFGDYFQEKLEYAKDTTTDTKSREGYTYGAQLHF